MTTTVSEAATGLPVSTRALNRPVLRRGFLAGLARLPLIGGSVALLGQPSAVAEPVTQELLEAYKTWLALEHRFLASRMADDPRFIEAYSNCFKQGANRSSRAETIGRYEWFVGRSDSGHENSYQHAALVLSAVGCDWRDREQAFNFGSA